MAGLDAAHGQAAVNLYCALCLSSARLQPCSRGGPSRSISVGSLGE